MEAAYNFQNNNFGRGDLGNGRVITSIQDSMPTLSLLPMINLDI